MSDTITTTNHTATSDANTGAGTNGEGNGSAPRPEKVAIVEEITEKLNNSVSVFVTEYRGMSVGALANLRAPLREAGAEHKVYKNTLARLAATNAGYEALIEHLTGPTALTFVTGDSVAAAKALADLSRTNPLLVIRGGVLGTSPLSADDVKALASLPSREELLARIAGAFQAPLVKTAGLLQALPRNLAYGLSALIEKQEQQSADTAA
jgi:large subunit ribosomal protein L10